MTINEVAKKFGLTCDTLRYYEKIGLIPQVTRTVGGIRNYLKVDMDWIEFVKCMRDSGVSVKSLCEYVDLYQQGESTHEMRKLILINEQKLLQKRISDLQNTLKKLDCKISNYHQTMKNQSLSCIKNTSK